MFIDGVDEEELLEEEMSEKEPAAVYTDLLCTLHLIRTIFISQDTAQHKIKEIK